MTHSSRSPLLLLPLLLLPLLLLLLAPAQGQEPVDVTTNSTESQPCSSEPKGVMMGDILPGIANGTMVVVDVRRPEELKETGKIPGSFNVPLSEVRQAFALDAPQFETQYGFPKPAPETLVYSCRSGRRATSAWNQTVDLGYCEARVFFGSWLEWAENKQPVEQVL